MAYGWCSAICKEHPDLGYVEELLFLSLRISFRGLAARSKWATRNIIHTKHHRRMVKIVFDSGDDEVVGDFLHAWVLDNPFFGVPLGSCAKYLVDLQRVTPDSQRLRQLVIHSIEHTDFWRFERIGMEKCVALLNRLDIGVDDVGFWSGWLWFLIRVAKSPEGRRSFSRRYLELMVDLAVSGSQPSGPIDELQIVDTLEEAQEWDTLVYWVGLIWVTQRPKVGGIQEDLERTTLSLFRQRPGAIQKLERWMQRASYLSETIECLRWVCERAGLEAVLLQDGT